MYGSNSSFFTHKQISQEFPLIQGKLSQKRMPLWTISSQYTWQLSSAKGIGAHPLTFFSFTFFRKDILPLLRTTLHFPYHIQVQFSVSTRKKRLSLGINYSWTEGNWKIKDGNITVPKDQCNDFFLERMQSKLWWKSSLGPPFTCEQQCNRDCLFYILSYIKCTILYTVLYINQYIIWCSH